MEIFNFINQINDLAWRGEPFIFLTDFEMEKPLVYRLNEAAEKGLLYDIRGMTNVRIKESKNETFVLKIHPVSESKYQQAFKQVRNDMQLGNTYLLNLTFPTPLEGKPDLEEIFYHAHAPYKLFKKNDFVFYSPECFIKISENKIFSYPMKGTIDATIENAKEVLLANKKELYEHNTIVDLIRNDLAMVSKNIRVIKFRYIDTINTPAGALLQMSSEICGELENNWQNHLGEIIVKLLPAGSVSGAPKKKTCEIIRSVERQKRGYYTGIFGIFDGQNLDSAVNIRFIEKYRTGFRYRSGGGITFLSDAKSEYRELIEKIYVPVNRDY